MKDLKEKTNKELLLSLKELILRKEPIEKQTQKEEFEICNELFSRVPSPGKVKSMTK